MFDSLSSKLSSAFKKIRGKATLSEGDILATLKEVRMALLEADVNFKVAKDFCDRVAEKAKGEEVQRSLTPDQTIIKLVQEELSETMGAGAAGIHLHVAPPLVIMMVGLQGSGKTTTVGKLGRYLRDEHKRKPLLVPADVYRKAAIEQLKTVGRQLDLAVFESEEQQDPVDIARRAEQHAKNAGYDTVIIDTAGRLQIDQELMRELQEIVAAVEPHEILLVADAMTGQEAVNVAQGFDAALELDGLILTKLDGDARGGAALSMKAVTGKPIKFIGLGEKLDALEVFHPERMASRILGMGDVLSLIEKATKEVDIEDAIAMQRKMAKNEFTFDDFLSQLRMMKRMGSITSLMGMIPGMSKMMKQVDPEQAERELKKTEAIILSMTAAERKNPNLINSSRRKRIARGSGMRVQDVNQLLKQFAEMRKMMRQFSKMGMGGLGNLFGGGMPDIGKLMRGLGPR